MLAARAQLDGGRANAEAALRLVDRLLKAAEDGGRDRSVIELLVLRALAARAAGDRAAATESLDRALALAEPEGYVRIFLDEGPAMADLLERATKQGRFPAHARRILEAFDNRVTERPRRQPLIEPLSQRELAVLRLLTSELDGPGIARELVVSVNTLRTHTKNIFAKLGVNSRRAAVRRAAELDLLARRVDRSRRTPIE